MVMYRSCNNFNYIYIFAVLIVISQYSFAQKEKNRDFNSSYFSNFDFFIESGVNNFLIKGDYSLQFNSETSSKLEYNELIKNSMHRETKLGSFMGLGINYKLNDKFSIGLMYQTGRNQEISETGKISSIKVIGLNVITTQSSGRYSLSSKFNYSSFMFNITSNFFIINNTSSIIKLNYGVSVGYSKIKELTLVSVKPLYLNMYSEGFNSKVESTSFITNEETRTNNLSWSLNSNISFELRKSLSIAIGYRFTKLGETILIKRPNSSINLVQVYSYDNQDNSETIETLSLTSTNNKLKLFSHSFMFSIIF